MPSGPINILDAFTRGRLVKPQKVAPASGITNFLRPPEGKAWLILDIILKHVTGTDTIVEIQNYRASSTHFATEDKINFVSKIPSAQATGICSAFNTLANYQQSQRPPILVMTHDDGLGIMGDASARVSVFAIEWDIEKVRK